MMKRLMLMAVLILLFSLSTAYAGEFYDIIVAADGAGVNVYTVPRGRMVGMLYNGYEDFNVDFYKEENGWFPLDLTDDFTVYVHEKTAAKNFPDTETDKEWKMHMPCSAFVGQVIEDGAVMRSKPDKRGRLIARHAAGSQFIVWGEFGPYYYVTVGGYWRIKDGGFISKESMVRLRDLSYIEAKAWNSTDYFKIDTRTVYAEAGGVLSSGSALRISENWCKVYRNGKTVGITAYLPNGWAQLEDGSFLETRYLEPEGDHRPAKTAVVRPTKVLNRLNVRNYADTNAGSAAKLCSGVEVEVISETEDWAVIFLVGAYTVKGIDDGIVSVEGCVQKKYLADAETAKVPDGRVRVKATADLLDDRKTRVMALNGDSGLRVIGTEGSWNQTDSLLIQGDDGRLFVIKYKDPVLEPVSYPDVKVKTTGKTKMRSGPANDADAVRTLQSGTRVKVLLRGEAWTMIQYQDTVGYVLSKYLRFP